MLDREEGEMVEIVSNEHVNVSYDRVSNSIIAVLKENEEGLKVQKFFSKIEYAFSKYNAKYLISDCSLNSQNSRECLDKFIKNLIKTRIEKIALIGNECAVKFDELGSLTSCKTQHFPCINTAQEWIVNGEEKLAG